MEFDYVLNALATILFLGAAIVLWSKHHRFGATVLTLSVLCSSGFVWFTILQPVAYDPNAGFPLWYRALGGLSVVAFVAIAGVLFSIARQLPSAAPNPSFKRDA